MFDPNDGECLASWASNASCPEGLSYSNYYDFWMLTGNVAAEVGWNPREIRTRSNCGAVRGNHFGYAERGDWMSCAEMCQNFDGCNYFQYDPNDGECFETTTTNDECAPEGFMTSNWYNFYGI